MTKKQRERAACRRIEADLKNLGVYDPYATLGDWVYRDQSALGQNFDVDSYPLTAVARVEYDRQAGAVYRIKVRDCSLARIGQDPHVAEKVIDACSNVLRPIAEILNHLHSEAHDRAKRQESECIARNRQPEMNRSV